MDSKPVAVVTGGGGGIGAACARRLADSHAVVVTDANVGAAEKVAAELGGAAFECDVASATSVEAVIARIEAEAGPIAATALGRVVFRARDLTVDEMALAGIGRSGGEFVAFAYSPLGEIVTLRLGDALADGAIAAVDANGVLVDTSEGPVRISLAIPRPR